MTLPPEALAAAGAALVDAVRWPAPWYFVAWAQGEELHLLPVEGTLADAKRRAFARWQRRGVHAVWLLELLHNGDQGRVVLQLSAVNRAAT